MCHLWWLCRGRGGVGTWQYIPPEVLYMCQMQVGLGGWETGFVIDMVTKTWDSASVCITDVPHCRTHFLFLLPLYVILLFTSDFVPRTNLKYINIFVSQISDKLRKFLLLFEQFRPAFGSFKSLLIISCLTQEITENLLCCLNMLLTSHLKGRLTSYISQFCICASCLSHLCFIYRPF
jgi:hypothetical protein